jgi:quercetin dioxygenase-like cupin family protein
VYETVGENSHAEVHMSASEPFVPPGIYRLTPGAIRIKLNMEAVMKQMIWVVAILGLFIGMYALAATGTDTTHDNDPTFRSVTDEDLEWTDYQPAGFGPGLQIAVIHGDPSVPDEPYTIRASFTDGYIIPAHYHPRAENLTVMSGTFMLAKGEAREDSKMVGYRPGDFLYIPGGHPHYGKARGPTVIQLHGIGPFQTIVVEELASD